MSKNLMMCKMLGSSRSLAFLFLLFFGGCGTIPNNGPIAKDVAEAAANKGALEASSGIVEKFIFDIVDVNAEIADITSRFTPVIFSKTFGLGTSNTKVVAGAGDTFNIAVFEAGPDGLFSTAEKKSTDFAVTIQADGTASIPYVGSIKFAGMSVEGMRSAIVSRLKGKAVEPDAIVTLLENGSRTVSVNGQVGKPSQVPLGIRPDRILDILAKAGGPQGQPYETSLTITRGNRSGTMLLKNLIDRPSENIFVRPGDQIYVSKEDQSFTVLGSTNKSAKIEFNAGSISLVEAVALAGGSNNNLADPKNLFVFRYEHQHTAEAILGKERFQALLASGIRANEMGQYPIVYRINMLEPQSYLVGQSFEIRNKDVLYLSRHPTTDLTRFISLINSITGVVRNASSL